MLLLEPAPEQEAISSDEGSRINGILCELLSLSELSYIHLHGDKKRPSPAWDKRNVRLGDCFHQKLGLGGILYNARRSAVALGQILGTGIIL
jgi:hypothetical protein